jgi:hypothetical protein
MVMTNGATCQRSKVDEKNSTFRLYDAASDGSSIEDTDAALFKNGKGTDGLSFLCKEYREILDPIYSFFS